MLSLDLSKINQFISETEFSEVKKQVRESSEILHTKTGSGNDFLGWLNLPDSYDTNTVNEILELSNNLKRKIDFLVLIGIGGSYLGTRAVS